MQNKIGKLMFHIWNTNNTTERVIAKFSVYVNYVFILFKLFPFEFTVEHLMYFASTIFGYFMRIRSCHFEGENQWELFFRLEHGHIFAVIPYHISVSIIVLVRARAFHLYYIIGLANCLLLHFIGSKFRIHICLELHGHFHNANQHRTGDSIRTNQRSTRTEW